MWVEMIELNTNKLLSVSEQKRIVREEWSGTKSGNSSEKKLAATGKSGEKYVSQAIFN